MPLVKFHKSTTLMDKYAFECDKIYQLPKRLAVKFCYQVGIAEEVEAADDALPNPAAELFDADDNVIGTKAPAAPPAPKVEAKTNPEPEPDKVEVDIAVEEISRYELKLRSGPWHDVVDLTTGEQVNEKPLRKSDAQALLEKLLAGGSE